MADLDLLGHRNQWTKIEENGFILKILPKDALHGDVEAAFGGKRQDAVYTTDDAKPLEESSEASSATSELFIRWMVAIIRSHPSRW